MSKNILLTGAAGFIGFHVAQALLKRGDKIVGVDNLTNYYDVNLKKARLNLLATDKNKKNFTFYKYDLSRLSMMKKIFKKYKFDKICHLAAQPGVRYSLEDPFIYEKTNNLATLNLLELCKEFGVKHFVFASSSSVYGGNKKVPFSTSDNVDSPVSLYAATKKYNELMAHTYSHLYKINCTGLRFFTVYGPFGRPDMAYFSFTKKILNSEEIPVFNYGKMKRDFTHISDIVSGVLAALDKPFKYKIFNLGNSKTVELRHFINCIESNLGIKSKKKLLPMQPGDVPITYANIKESTRLLGYKPKVKIEQGLKNFVDWYKEYYKK